MYDKNMTAIAHYPDSGPGRPAAALRLVPGTQDSVSSADATSEPVGQGAAVQITTLRALVDWLAASRPGRSAYPCHRAHHTNRAPLSQRGAAAGGLT
jgi:hypothetical protein